MYKKRENSESQSMVYIYNSEDGWSYILKKYINMESVKKKNQGDPSFAGTRGVMNERDLEKGK